jgi:hypothetical protein
MLGWQPCLHAHRIIPDAPVSHFKLPMFGSNGYKTWELQGKEGRYLNTDQILVDGMCLRVFSGDERLLQELVLESPHALIFIREHRAEGKDLLFISGATFTIIGKGWEWDGANKTIRVNHDVQVTFKESLKDAF